MNSGYRQGGAHGPGKRVPAPTKRSGGGEVFGYGKVFKGDTGAVAQVEGGHAPVAGRGPGAAAPLVAGLRVRQDNPLFALAFQYDISLAVKVDFLLIGAVFNVDRARFRRRIGQAADGRLNGAELLRAIRGHTDGLGAGRQQHGQQRFFIAGQAKSGAYFSG